jgi:threonine synthase
MMGLDIGKLIICTNSNDILTRFVETGIYDKRKQVIATHSPAMDILVSSNFERALWHIIQQDSSSKVASEKIKEYMDSLATSGAFTVSPLTLIKFKEFFSAYRVSDSEIQTTITNYYTQHNCTDLKQTSKCYILDPHTAVGVSSALEHFSLTAHDPNLATIVISTASPGKFPEVVLKALDYKLSFDDIAPSGLRGLEKLPRRVTDIDGCGDFLRSVDLIKNVVVETLRYDYGE